MLVNTSQYCILILNYDYYLQLEILDDHHRPASASSVVDSTASAAEETAINSSPARDGLLVYDRLGMKRRIIEKYVRTPRVSCSLGKKGSHLYISLDRITKYLTIFNANIKL